VTVYSYKSRSRLTLFGDPKTGPGGGVRAVRFGSPEYRRGPPNVGEASNGGDDDAREERRFGKYFPITTFH